MLGIGIGLYRRENLGEERGNEVFRGRMFSLSRGNEKAFPRHPTQPFLFPFSRIAEALFRCNPIRILFKKLHFTRMQSSARIRTLLLAPITRFLDLKHSMQSNEEHDNFVSRYVLLKLSLNEYKVKLQYNAYASELMSWLTINSSCATQVR